MASPVSDDRIFPRVYFKTAPPPFENDLEVIKEVSLT
jgi:hypothetical protein